MRCWSITQSQLAPRNAVLSRYAKGRLRACMPVSTHCVSTNTTPVPLYHAAEQLLASSRFDAGYTTTMPASHTTLAVRGSADLAIADAEVQRLADEPG